MKLSVVSPVYRAELVLDELVERIAKSIPSAFNSYEIILVDDFSPDKSWNKIVEISNNNSNVRGFKLSRNFGQHYAITAGLNQVFGDYVVVLDCDLQDQPEEIEKLFNESQKGFDIVLARRYERKDSFYKKTVSKLFYKTLSYLTGTKQDATVANFGIYSKQVIDEIVC
jgi:polyisoprenyl-phosphate glycosyltransferase